ncbi:MAG: [Alphaproteobacteria bacterium]|nr:[FeFe] hydrogenase H-cluster radical SAM maturase HydE [Alphaproteobacteria bacterium]MBQ7284730.1 [FeFe] hydrogenase H-cluster radical SAM maturase HydE [Alphaproteobacteria bacterium]
MSRLIQKAISEHNLTRSELIELLYDDSCAEELFSAADEVRRQYVGDEIHLRALIEFSNICRNNCCYCGLRRDNKNIERYRIDESAIFKLAEHAAKNMGLKTIVLQSGEDMFFTTEILCNIIRQIKTLDVALTLSVGEKSLEEYQAYRQAGANRFLLRIETTDKDLYLRHDPGMSWEQRVQCLRDLRTAGLEVGSGCLVGLPEQKVESYADDILFFKKIDADMIGIGPFIPHPDTPLKNASGGTLNMALKVMALTRLLLPDINIPATTAMESLAPNGQRKALQSGANVIMPNVTLTTYRKHYELYPGKSTTGYTPDDSLRKVKELITSIGRKIGQGYGASKHFKR